MANCSEICKLLRNDKVTHRAKGKKQLEELLIKDKCFLLANDVKWWNIISSLMDWESKELNFSCEKKKDIRPENAEFVKQVMKHGMPLSACSSTRCNEVLCHILSILYDRKIKPQYHIEHLNCLCDLMDNPKFAVFMSVDSIIDVFNYLKQYIETSSFNLPILPRILKVFASANFKESIRTGILKELVVWYSDVLDSLLDSTTTCEKLFPVICEAFTTILTQHGNNSTAYMFRHAHKLLATMPRFLSSIPYHNRDPLLRFLLTYLRTCSLQPRHTDYSLTMKDPLSKSLATLFDVIAHPDYLRTVLYQTKTVYQQSKHASTGAGGKDSFVNYTDDTRFTLNMEVIALVFLVAQDTFRKHPTEGLWTGSNPSRFCAVHCTLFDHAEKALNGSGTNGYMATGTTQLSTGFGLSILTASQSASQLHAPSVSLRSSALESWLYLLSTLCRLQPDGGFLRQVPSCCQHDSVLDTSSLTAARHDGRAHEVSRWVLLLRTKLCGEFDSLSGRSWDAQSLGALLCALVGLAESSVEMLQCGGEVAKVLCDYWSQFIEGIVGQVSMTKLCLGACPSSSVSEQLMKLLSILMSNYSTGSSTTSHLLHPSTLYRLQNWLWANYIAIYDPRAVESEIFYRLFAILVGTSKMPVPDGVSGLYYQFLELNDASSEYLRFQSLTGSIQGGIHVALWIDAMLDSTVSTRSVLVKNLGGYLVAIRNTIQSVFESGTEWAVTWPENDFNYFSNILSREEAGLVGGKINWFNELPVGGNRSMVNLTMQGRVGAAATCAGAGVQGLVPSRVVQMASTLQDILGCLKRRLDNKMAAATTDDNTEFITSWQVATVLLSGCYVSLAQVLNIAPLESKSTHIDLAVKTSLDQFWKLQICAMDSIKQRPGLLRNSSASTAVVGYLSCCCALVSGAAEVGGCSSFSTQGLGHSDSTGTIETTLPFNLRDRVIAFIRVFMIQSLSDAHRSALAKTSATSRSSSHPSAGSLSRQSSSATLTDDIDDDFMEVSGPGTQLVTHGSLSRQSSDTGLGSGGNGDESGCDEFDIRVMLSNDHLHILCSLMATAIACTPCARTMDSVLDAIILVENDSAGVGNGRKFWFSSELALYLGERVAMVSSYHGIREFITSNTSWEVDWNVLGYCKVLSIVKHLTSRDVYFVDSGQTVDGMCVEECIDEMALSVFPSDDDEGTPIYQYLEAYWMARVLRLECGSHFFSARQAKYKVKFGHLVIKGLTDIDNRVQASAQSLVPLLFKVLPTHTVIYQSIRRSLDVEGLVCTSLCTEPRAVAEGDEEDRSLSTICSRAESICLCACSSRGVLHLALCDVLFLCCSPSQYSSQVNDERSAVSLRALVDSLASRIAAAHDYTSTTTLFMDHLTFLISEWCKLRRSSDEVSEEYWLRWQSFPFQLMGFNSLERFLVKCSKTIIPIVCGLQPPLHRWTVLSAYAELSGHGAQDAGIAKIIRQNAVAIRAKETSSASGGLPCPSWFCSSAYGSLTPDAVKTLSTEEKERAVYIRQFIARVTSSSEFEAIIEEYVSDMLFELLTLTVFHESVFQYTESAVLSDMSEKHQIYTFEKFSSEMTSLLDFAARQCGLTNITSLICRSNCVFTLGSLSTSMRETTSPHIKFALTCSICYLIACIMSSAYLMSQDAQGGKELICRASLQAVVTCVECAPRFVSLVCNAIDSMVHSIQGLLASQRLSSSFIEDILPDILADLICLSTAVSISVKLQSAIRISSAATSSSAVPAIANDLREARNSYVGRRFKGLIEVFGAITMPRVETDRLAHALNTLCGEVISMCTDADRSILYSCLPLPPVFANLLDVNSHLVGIGAAIALDPCGLEVRTKIASFTSSVARRLHTEVISKSLTWLQLVAIQNCIQAKNSLTSRRDGLEVDFTWKSDGPMLGSFISALLSLGTVEVGVAGSSELLRDVAHVLGSVGVVDSHSLDQGSVASLQHPEFSAEKVKLRTMSLVFMHVWEGSPAVSRRALQTIQDVLSTGVMRDVLATLTDPTPTRVAIHTVLDMALSPSYLQEENNETRPREAWSPDVWSTGGKDFETWMTSLTSALIRECYLGITPSVIGPNAGSSSSSTGIHSSQVQIITGKDPFIPLMLRMAESSVSIAECIFPLIVADLLEANEAAGVACADILSNRMRTYLLSSACSIPSATRVCCNTLVYLLRQHINHFVDKSATKSKKRPRPLESQKSSGRENAWALPYSLGLNIDYKYIAEAAARCGCICTAELFIELSTETIRGINAPVSTPHLHESSRQFVKDDFWTSGVSELLMKVYKEAHNPDAVFSLAQSADLNAQVTVQTQTGNWSDALVTYDNIMQCLPLQGDKVGSTMISTTGGISTALEALGCQHLLQQYCQSTTVSSEYLCESSSEQCWRSEFAFLWNQGVNAVQTLSQWSSSSKTRNLTDIVSSFSQAQCPQYQNLQGPNISSSAMMVSSRGSDYFNGNIAASLRDLQQGECHLATQRADQCMETILPRVLVLFQQETSHKLLGDMAKLQKLVEIKEAAKWLSDPRRINGEGHRQSSSTFRPISESGNSASSPDLHTLDAWKGRLKFVSSDHVSCESILSLRVLLLLSLRKHSRDTVGDPIFLEIMEQVQDVSDSKMTANAFSPLVHKLKAILAAPPTPVVCSDGFMAPMTPSFATTELSRAKFAIQECRHMWTRGMRSIASNLLMTDAVHPLRRTLAKASKVRRESADRDAEAIADTLSESLRIAGEWTAARRTAGGSQILNEFLIPAVENAKHTASRVKAHLTLAKFNASLHINAKNRVESAEWVQGRRVLEERRFEFDQCKNLYRAKYTGNHEKDEACKLLTRHLHVLRKEIEMDDAERKEVEESVQRHVGDSLNHFKEVLVLSQEPDVDAVFQVMSLWFANSSNDDVNRIIRDLVIKTATFKFVSLTYQVMSRLDGSAGVTSGQGTLKRTSPVMALKKTNMPPSSPAPANPLAITNGVFQSVLAELLFALCRDHPYHTLPQLLALANEKVVAGEPNSFDRTYSSDALQTRVAAANGILHRLRAEFEAIKKYSSLVDTMDVVLRAYIDLASTGVEKWVKSNRTKDIKFSELSTSRSQLPFNECVHSSSVSSFSASSSTAVRRHSSGASPGAHMSLTLFPILTKQIRVQADCDYAEVVKIHSIMNAFSLTDSGLSRPKIIKINGSDGAEYTQLVKGGDDTRQDAVMEQVFEHVNGMLQTNKSCRMRNLKVRTYKIIPLTPQTGIIEWVDNTVPFGSYLCDKSKETTLGAHSRYFPNDLSHSQARDKLADAKEDKAGVFSEICHQFHPAFRFFFLENFPHPSTWVTSRVAYTRAVAVTSMLGYILGIGDRHAHNILIDAKTAEVVHIDFGIMFEQGKALGTPETVPFRLTRDIVDGMGVTGCEGTFRRCCEEVLSLLRANTSQLLTILEVVIHDPLYKWSLSPIQARRRQHGEADSSNAAAGMFSRAQGGETSGLNGDQDSTSSKDAARRALRRIKDKLQGYEELSGESLGVEGQVGYLICEARDPKNLCRLYPGWAPWL